MNGKKWNGKGYDQNGNIIYELINGTGKVKEYDYLGRLKFEGELLKGRRNGKGKEYDIFGNIIFEGEYSNENRSKGIEYNNKGRIIFEGEYLKGKKYKGKEIKNDDNDYFDNVKSFELEFDIKMGIK